MAFKFGKDSGDSPSVEASGEKKKQSALLVLLLILVGGIMYLYFFTDLIKTQEAQKPVEAPAAATEVVKMPLPPREDESAQPAGKAAEKSEVAKTAVPVPVTASAPAVKPATAPTKPEPAPAQPKPKVEPKKAEASKQTDKKPQPVPVAGKNSDKSAATTGEEKKPGAEAKKPAVADKKSSTAKDIAVKTKKTASDSWSLNIGNYVLEEAMSTDMGRVRKAGFEPVIKPSARKKTAMNRLFVSEFNDKGSARSTLEKLKHHTSDAFVIEQGGKFAVYAGSYLQSEAANSEIERLKGSGITATIKHTDISIPSRSLSVGPFKSKKSAEAALGKLKSAGLKATLSQK